MPAAAAALEAGETDEALIKPCLEALSSEVSAVTAITAAITTEAFLQAFAESQQSSAAASGERVSIVGELPAPAAALTSSEMARVSATRGAASAPADVVSQQAPGAGAAVLGGDPDEATVPVAGPAAELSCSKEQEASAITAAQQGLRDMAVALESRPKPPTRQPPIDSVPPPAATVSGSEVQLHPP